MSETTKADVAMRARRAQDHISYIRDALLIGSVEPSTTTLVDHLLSLTTYVGELASVVVSMAGDETK